MPNFKKTRIFNGKKFTLSSTQLVGINLQRSAAQTAQRIRNRTGKQVRTVIRKGYAVFYQRRKD